MIKVSVSVENKDGSVDVLFLEVADLSVFGNDILQKSKKWFVSFESYTKKRYYSDIAGYDMALAQNNLADYNFIYTKDGVWRISCVEKTDEYATMAHYMYPLHDYLNKQAKKI